MRRRVVPFNSPPPLRIHLHPDRPLRLNHRLREVHRHAPRPADRPHHLHLLSVPFDPARISHLSPHLPIKRRRRQKHFPLRPPRPGLLQRLRRKLLHLCLLGLLIPGENGREIRPRLLLHLDRRLALRLPRPLPLPLHRLLKTLRIHRQPPLPRQELRQIQRKAVGVIKREGILTLDALA